MRKTDNQFSGIVGVPLTPVENEADHFYVCTKCGQAVDMRDLGQVMHHEQAEHERLSDQ
jgi:hypothetical protein